ncbi:MAG: gliding motility-associated C-terminal domain-containing protein [Flavobacteriales bacterium]|nr:gliding motility-associated C-terminal domain-containing protein [Flavobacteriales bacterium]
MIKKAILTLFFGSFLSGIVSANNGSTPPPGCPTIQATAQHVSCYGAFDGQATISIIVPSFGPYTYTWSNGVIQSGTQTSSTISNLPAGGYTVNIKDETTGCVVTGGVIINSPDPISISGSVTDVLCSTQATGEINTTINGGTPNYSFNWTGPTSSTAQNLTSALAGNYTLTVTDVNLCTASKDFIIDQPNEPMAVSASISNPSCFGGTNGAIDITVSGGTTSYSYSWSNAQTTQDLVGLGAGVYDVTVTDANGCTSFNSYNVAQPTILSGVVSTTDVLCNGDATGSLEFTPSGGTPGYTYQWSNSTTLFAESGPILSNVVADDYSVTVTDSKGCQLNIPVTTVNQPPALALSTIPTHVSCNGGNDGEIDLSVSGGTGVGTYSFAWTNSNSVSIGTSEDLSGLVAETYTCVVEDANNCIASISQEITEPPVPITVIFSSVDVLCHGDNTGSIDLTISGGTPSYVVSWTSGQSTEDITNLLAGTYGYTVTDANGCLYNDAVTINEPTSPLTATSTITDVNCFGESNGIIDLTPTGGTGSYTFVWSNSTFNLSVQSEDLVGYPADSYRFEIEDENGCTFVDTVDINEPPALATTMDGVNILCHGDNTGSIDLTVTGGVPNYTYSWNTSAITQDINLLTAGLYSVTVTDANGCTIDDNLELTEPLESLSYSAVVTDVLCKNGTDGEIDLTVNGGTSPYSYQWSNGDTVSTIIDLTAGTYIFTATDFNGCQLSDVLLVEEPDAVTLNETITPVTCFGLSDGIIDISPIGGTAPYSFSWFNSNFALSAQTEDLVGFPAETYQLEILDSNNCFYEMFLVLPEPEELVIDYDFNVVSCFQGSDGNINVDITGGNPGYTTLWSNGATSEDLINVPSDIYTLIATDTKGCQDSITVELGQPNEITMSFDHTPVTCIDQNDGIAFVYPIGGNEGYTYLWSNGDISDVNLQLSNQYYSVIVTDVLGCTGVDSVFVSKDENGCIDPVTAFSPNGDNYNDTWVIDNMELYPDADVQVFNKWGTRVYHSQGLYEPWNGRSKGAESPAAVYYWVINLGVPDRENLKGTITILR